MYVRGYPIPECHFVSLDKLWEGDRERDAYQDLDYFSYISLVSWGWANWSRPLVLTSSESGELTHHRGPSVCSEGKLGHCHPEMKRPDLWPAEDNVPNNQNYPIWSLSMGSFIWSQMPLNCNLGNGPRWWHLCYGNDLWTKTHRQKKWRKKEKKRRR